MEKANSVYILFYRDNSHIWDYLICGVDQGTPISGSINFGCWARGSGHKKGPLWPIHRLLGLLRCRGLV